MKKMSTNRNTLHIYWQHARKYKRDMAIIYPSMVLAQLAEDMLSPLLISGILTKLAQGHTAELTIAKLMPTLLIIIGLELFALLMWNQVVRRFWRTQDAIMRDLNTTVFNHLTNMSYRFYSDRFAGSLVSQSNKFIGSFERLTDPLTWNVFKLLVSLTFTTVILLPRVPQVAIAILVISAIYTPIVWLYRRRQVPYNRRWAEAETKRTGQLADSFTNILAIKSFASENFERQRMSQRSNEVHQRSTETMTINMNHELVTGSIQRSINVIVLVLSASLAVQGKIQIGIIYLSLNYTTSILKRLWDLGGNFRNFTRVFGDSTDMSEILQLKPEISDKPGVKPFKATNGELSINKITFWYPETNIDHSLFKDFTLNIKAGEKIGLVGPSGGGKTSITKLLLRFMDIQSGSIEIDGRNITDMTQADLRRSISYVPQEPLLFHRTLTENISYGTDNVSQEMIDIAARKAHADEFIAKLSNGYKTLVGERGIKLSGGQKQRIAIARAFIKDAPILLLDEATSALDSESEVLIQDALWKLMEGKTTVVIAHRLSTIQKMDRIIVLDDGKIVEEGSHKNLIAKKGLYAKLWSHQSGGFIQE